MYSTTTLFLVICVAAISAVPTKGGVITPVNYPLYKQCNHTWGGQVMQKNTICQSGSLLTCFSMTLPAFGIPINSHPSDPSILNKWLQKNNGFNGTDAIDLLAVQQIDSRIGFVTKWPMSHLHQSYQLQSLIEAYSVIANVGDHYVLLTGYDTALTKWYANDPRDNSAFFHWNQMTELIVYDL